MRRVKRETETKKQSYMWSLCGKYKKETQREAEKGTKRMGEWVRKCVSE